MAEPVEGVIHGKTIELAIDPGFRDSEIIQVVIRRVKRSPGWSEGVGGTAGALAQMPPEYFADLEEIVRERQRWPYREVPALGLISH